MKRTFVIFCAFDPQNSLRSWKFCRFLKLGFRGVHLTVVTNSSAIQQQEVKEADALVLGTNNDWEWSAYDEGLNSIRSSLGEDDGVLFINDTACEHRLTPALAISYMHQIIARKGKYILGFEDIAPFSQKGELLLGKKVCSWISTWLFYVSATALMDIGGLRTELDTILPPPGGPHDPAVVLAKLPKGIAEFLDWYLFGGGPTKGDPITYPGVTIERGWKGQTALSAENYPVFRQKLHNIVQEYLLTARVREIGQVLDIRKAESCGYQIHMYYSRDSKARFVD